MELEFSQAVLCLSGGMDSTSLLLHLLREGIQIHAISFDYGQRHNVELLRLQANLAYLDRRELKIDWHLVDLRTLRPILDSALTDLDRNMPLGHYADQSMRETVVPNRNAIFSAIAYAQALSIVKRSGKTCAFSLAVHSGDHAIYPDCRPEFYAALLAAFRVGNWESENVVEYLPYLNLDKKSILIDAQQSIATLDLDFETIFRNTCTSYLPDSSGRSHGLTGSDVERILAFDSLGLRDPLEYQSDWNSLVAEAKRLSIDAKSLS